MRGEVRALRISISSARSSLVMEIKFTWRMWSQLEPGGASETVH